MSASIESKSLLRRMWERGDKLSLSVTSQNSVNIEIITSSGKDVPKEWMEKVGKILAASMRQTKKNGDISNDDINLFFSGGGVLIEELSVDDWLRSSATEQ